MNFKIAKFVFLKQADLKTNCTRLYGTVCFVLMITYNMLTQNIIFEYFQNSVQLLANELKRYITTS